MALFDVLLFQFQQMTNLITPASVRKTRFRRRLVVSLTSYHR